jgi:hypothetical protein
MDTSPREPSIDEFVSFATILLFVSLFGGAALAWDASALAPLRLELSIVLGAALFSTLMSAIAFGTRARAAQQLSGNAQKFVMIREAQAHAVLVWLATFAMLVAAVVVLRLTRSAC